MKKIFFILAFALMATACSAQYIVNGRLQLKSGRGLNYVSMGANMLYFNWNADTTFQLSNSDTSRFLLLDPADTSARFFGNATFDNNIYSGGSIYWPGSENSYIRGGTLYFVNSTDFLQAIPTQLKVSAGTQDYTTLNSYRLHLNKAASTSIDIDTNGIVLNNTDFTVRDNAGFEYLKHNYGDSSTTIKNYLNVDTLVYSDGTKQSTAATGGGASYLVYVALISQSGTNAPISTVLENTTGSVFTWVYDDVGYYILQSNDSIFSENKMAVNVSFWPTYDASTVDNKLKVAGYNGFDSPTEIWFTSFMFYNSTVEYSNDCFFNTYLEIRFYP